MFCANLFYAHVRHERHLNSTVGWAPNPLAGGSNQIHPQPKAFFSSDVLKCAAWWWCLGLKLARRHWYSGPLWFLCTVPSHYSAYLALIQSTVMRYIYISCDFWNSIELACIEFTTAEGGNIVALMIWRGRLEIAFAQRWPCLAVGSLTFIHLYHLC